MQTNATLPAKLSALPEPWIEKIFGHMTACYGSLFMDRWKDSNLADVKRIWASELASFSDSPECFRAALKSVVEECKFPPTLPEFVELCRRHYVRPAAGPALTYREPEPISHARAVEVLREIKNRFPAMFEKKTESEASA